MGLEHKATSTSPDAGLIGTDDHTGIVEAIVSVTGVRDEDADVIEPGAYTKTLARRRPKGIFVHDWGRWVARTEHIEELLPGDSRLPRQAKDGTPWPLEAGGLYVRSRFNLKSDEGRNAYENVKFFSETGECDWSIGYRVPPGMGTRDRASGVRRIKEVDLYEYSPVLFGAAGSFSGTLSVKAATPEEQPEDAEAAPTVVGVLCPQGHHRTWCEHALATNRHEDGQLLCATCEEPCAHPVEEQSQDPEDDTPPDAEPLADGEPAEEPAGDAPAAEDDAEVAELHQAAMADVESESAPEPDPAQSGDPDADEGEGDTPPETPAPDAPPAAAQDPGAAAESGTKGVTGLVGGPPGWRFADGGLVEGKAGMPGVADTPGDRASFERLRQWYVHGQGAAQIRWGQPGDFDRCVRIARKHMDPEKAKGFCSNRHVDALGVRPGQEGGRDRKDAGEEVVESTIYPFLPGTAEELRQKLTDAAAEVLNADGDRLVQVVGTWPDRVVVTSYSRKSGGGAESYEIPYELTGDGCTLGEPEAVQLTIFDALKEQDQSAAAQESNEALSPFPGMVEEAAAGVKTLLAADGETKVGRVLSNANAKRLKAAVEQLVVVLRSAGVDIDTGPDDQRNEPSVQADQVMDSTAPSARTGTPVPATKSLAVDPALHARAWRIVADATHARV